MYKRQEYDSYKNIFENAKTDITDADKDRLIESLKTLSSGENIDSVVDIEQVIKYFVVHNFVVNGDSYTGSMIHNYYLYEKDGVMQMLPWDYNLAFGTFQSSDAQTSVNYPIDSPVSGGDMSDRPMISWIFGNEEYTNLYHEYFAQFISEFFDSGKVEKIIDDTVEMISPYVEKDPTKFCDYDSFVLGASTLKQFCILRAESISGQLGLTDSATVDASSLNISDMGTMGMGGKGGMPDISDSERPQKNSGQQSKPETTKPAEEDTTVSDPEAQTTKPQAPEMNGEMPDFNGEAPPGFNERLPEGFEFSESPDPSQPPEGFEPAIGQMPPVNKNQAA